MRKAGMCLLDRKGSSRIITKTAAVYFCFMVGGNTQPLAFIENIFGQMKKTS